MEFYYPPQEAKGHYRYDPTSLKQQGPARLFGYIGEDSLLAYIAERLQSDILNQGRLSQPASLFLQKSEENQLKLKNSWVQLNNLLSSTNLIPDWLEFSLPPGENFNRAFMQDRRDMTLTLTVAKLAAQVSARLGFGSPTETAKKQRQTFYQTLEGMGRSRPIVSLIHEREGELSDREFARQRLAGCNPTVIRSLQTRDQPILQAVEGRSLTLANGTEVDLSDAAANRLFVADYSFLKNLTPAELQAGRYVGSPIAMFYRGDSGLEPALIWLQSGQILLPPQMGTTKDDWMRAKLMVQCADLTHHELIAHLGDTHLAMEAFAIATPRHLPQNHPLYRLLKPHFRFLLAINQRGNQLLLGEGAAIENLLAPTREASIALINRAYREKSFASYALPTQLKQRGVGLDSGITDFPYRDDALLLWEAIARYVGQFLGRYYADDQAVQQDPYLQTWAAELGASLSRDRADEFPQAPSWLPSELASQVDLDLQNLPNHPRVPDFPTAETPGRLTALQQLLDVATQVIFTCTAQHAAVNFSQFDYGGYIPNASMSLQQPPDQADSLATLLPTPEQELAQMELTFALSGIRWSQIGFPDQAPSDRGDLKLLQAFQRELSDIERCINTRNQERLKHWGVDYPYLLPSQIPNSINI